ncbi:small integral membrane protein 5 [Rhinophrynus dorsalis]
MSDKNMLDEVQKMGEKLLVKLKEIPHGDTVQIISLVIILLFIAVVLLMMIAACCHCCCCSRRYERHRAVKVRPADTA